MILYHGSTVYHSLCAIVHKLAFHPDEKAELLLVQYMFPEEEMAYFIANLPKTSKEVSKINTGHSTTSRFVPNSKNETEKAPAKNGSFSL